MAESTSQVVDLLGNALRPGDKIAIAEATTEYPYDMPFLAIYTISEVDSSRGDRVFIKNEDGAGGLWHESGQVVRVASPTS